MRRPQIWAWLGFALIAASLAALFVGVSSLLAADFYAPVDKNMRALALLGGPGALVGVLIAVSFSVRARDLARLRAGDGVIACWRVSAADWNSFLVTEGARTRVTRLRNKLKVGARARREGFEVRIDRNGLLCDDIGYNLRTGSLGYLMGGEVRDVSWVSGPIDALEFLRAYNEIRQPTAIVIRVPIPPDAVPQAKAALAAFRARFTPEKRAATRARYLPRVASLDDEPP